MIFEEALRAKYSFLFKINSLQVSKSFILVYGIITMAEKDDKMYEKIIMTKEFSSEILGILTDPNIERSNERMYNQLADFVTSVWRDDKSGDIVDTLKLMMFSVISEVMKQNAYKQFEDQREDLK